MADGLCVSLVSACVHNICFSSDYHKCKNHLLISTFIRHTHNVGTGEVQWCWLPAGRGQLMPKCDVCTIC